MPDPVKPGSVRIHSDDPDLTVHELLGPKKPRVVSPYGGWQVTARPRRIGLTDWVGRDPLKVNFDIMIESRDRRREFSEREGVRVEKACRALERMAGLDADDPEPPILKVDGGGAIPHDYHDASHVRWVIETLEWDEDAEERNDYGNRTRALANIVVMQYVEEERLSRLSAAHERRRRKKDRTKSKRSKKGAKKKEYVVKSGDTLAEIAARELGNYRRWTEIAQKNGIRDPRSLRVGQRLKLP